MSARFVSCNTVAELLTGPLKEEVAVVDVRDEDFYGGHIKGAINWDSSRFASDADVDELIARLGKAGRVIVHCMLSQQRGPRCAAKLAQRLEDRGMQQPAVLVMSGGFSQFNRLYGQNPALVELDEEEEGVVG